MTKVAVLGAGQIGRAVYKIITTLREETTTFSNIDAFVIDSSHDNIFDLQYGSHYVLDLNNSDVSELAKLLVDQKVTHVINALPFFLNEKAAIASVSAKCHYIDFTEDDVMADKVQSIFKDTDLSCATKCGLAPGFVNYIGYDLVKKLEVPDSLMVSVGALPRMVSFGHNQPEHSYNLSWSVDGLVNEYIRPCRIRKNGVEQEVAPLGNQTKVILDGIEYEAAYTSGGIGSLTKDLENVPNVCYMTLRYPGHYRFVKSVVQEKLNNFDEIKKVFLKKFPFTDDDVIVVYANLIGKNKGKLSRVSYYNKFYGTDGLTGIQSTTAGAGVAILELLMNNRISGIINHSNVDIDEFCDTHSFKKYYKT